MTYKNRHYEIYFLFPIPIIFIILDILGFEIGKEAYFYTLSTISQTLAAMMGLIAIFLIFRVDRETVLKNEKNTVNLPEHGKSKGLNEFVSDLREIGKVQKADRVKKRKLTNYAEHGKMIYGCCGPLVIGFIAMILSILALPFGWISMPNSISINSPKLSIIGIIIYLTLISIVQVIIFSLNIITIEYD